ncbi:FHA domain-containing protein [Nostocoides australiense]
MHYAPGAAVAVVAPGCAVLVSGDPAGSLPTKLLTALLSDGLEAAVDIVFSSGLRNAPDFAMCGLDAQGSVRVLVRGSGAAVVENAQGRHAVDTARLVADREFGAVSTVVLTLGADAGEARVPIVAGVTSADAVRCTPASAAAWPTVEDAGVLTAGATGSEASSEQSSAMTDSPGESTPPAPVEFADADAPDSGAVPVENPQLPNAAIAEPAEPPDGDGAAPPEGDPTPPPSLPDARLEVPWFSGERTVMAGGQVDVFADHFSPSFPPPPPAPDLVGPDPDGDMDATIMRADLLTPAADPPTVGPETAAGTIRLPGGEAFVMDRDQDIVMGRAPREHPGNPAIPPHLARISDPTNEVSAQHALISRVDAVVSVTDLDSTNGTEVIDGHGSRVRLAPHTPRTIEPGCVVILAGVATVAFEAP